MLEQLTVELFELNSRAKLVHDESSLREFFRWLLRTHRPRYSCQAEIGGEILEPRELSRVVLNVIAIYHIPEKNRYEDLWTAFSEEIVKVVCIFV